MEWVFSTFSEYIENDLKKRLGIPKPTDTELWEAFKPLFPTTTARLMVQEFTANEIRARVSEFWKNLSTHEQFSIADEYVERFRDILPRKTTEEIVRIKSSFVKVLNDHPWIVKELRDRNR